MAVAEAFKELACRMEADGGELCLAPFGDTCARWEDNICGSHRPTCHDLSRLYRACLDASGAMFGRCAMHKRFPFCYIKVNGGVNFDLEFFIHFVYKTRAQDKYKREETQQHHTHTQTQLGTVTLPRQCKNVIVQPPLQHNNDVVGEFKEYHGVSPQAWITSQARTPTIV